jgi:hypothetical protein
VSNLWDKTPEGPSSSELNPLTNPVLEQHLGRWAKVYFGNPPAKREQAVSKLLEEIKRESVQSVAAPSIRPYFATDPRFQRPVCAACQHRNPPGHKFCSRCGQPLNAAQPDSSAEADASQIPDTLPPNSATDVAWLGDHVFSSLNDSSPSQGRGWKYLAGAAVLILAGLAYRHWAPEFQTRVASTPNAPQVSVPAAPSRPENPATDDAKAPAETVAPRPSVPETKKPEVRNPPVTAEERDQAIVPPGVEAASQKSTLLSAKSGHSSVAEAQGSSPDLRLAQRYLAGNTGARNPSEAARLLWRAVSKQNATAAVLLSDLYVRGDGVPQSCDQARLLLVAAAKRGSPLAAQELRNLESKGCQ